MPGYELRYRQVDGLSPEELVRRLRWNHARLGWWMGEIHRNGDGTVEVAGFRNAWRIAVRVRPVRDTEKEVCIVCDDDRDAYGPGLVGRGAMPLVRGLPSRGVPPGAGD